MTDLIAELEEVVRLSNEAKRLPYGEGRAYAYRDVTVRALNFVLDYHATLAAMANELRVARESFKRCDEICKCTGEGWRTAEEDMAKRLEAAERDAFKWQLLCADCDDAGEGNRAAINVVNDACRLGSGALERHYGQAARDGLDAAIAATQKGEE